MEFGTIENTSDKGCIYYFSIDTDSPSHPSAKSARTYYVVTRIRSSERAFCFLCSLLCDLSDSHRMQQWYELYQSSLEKVPYNVFFEFVRTYAQCPTPPVVGAGQSHQLFIPALFTDEASARQALMKLLPSHTVSPPYSQKKGGTQQSSATPEKTAVMHTGERTAHHLPKGSQSTSLTTSLQSGDEAMSSIVGASQPYEVFSLEAAGLRDLWERINVDAKREKRANKENSHQSPFRQRQGEIGGSANRSGAEVVNAEVASDTLAEERARYDASGAHITHLKHKRHARHTHLHGTEDVNGASVASTKSLELVSILKSQLRAKELELDLERQHRQDERVKFQHAIASFEMKFQEMSAAHGEVLCKLVRENKETVDHLEADMARKEEELHRIYDVRVQDRDVHIIELTESVRALEKKNQELEQQVGNFAELQAYIKEWENFYAAARREYAKVLEYTEKLKGDLARTQMLVEQQQEQVLAAGCSMQRMQSGLAMIRGELPYLLKSGLFPNTS